MENNVPEDTVQQIEIVAPGEEEAVSASEHLSAPGSESPVPNNVKLLVCCLIDRYGLSREQLTSIYDEHKSATGAALAAAASDRRQESSVSSPHAHAQEQQHPGGQGHVLHVAVERSSGWVGVGQGETPMEVGEDDQRSTQIPGPAGLTVTSVVSSGTSTTGTSMEQRPMRGERLAGAGEAQAGKMQNLVQSALQNYEESPSASNTVVNPGGASAASLGSSSVSELGVKRKVMSLEEELKLEPTPFAHELLQ